MVKKLHITLVKSPVSCRPGQRRTLLALGLKRIGQTVEHNDDPTIRGMVRVVNFLVAVVESK